jgi:phosphocarrier protein HPr
VIEEYLPMQQQSVTIRNKLGLHARAAAKLVNTAGRFTSSVTLRNDHRSADAKSIMGIMMLAAAQGTELELTVEGEDEKEALESVVALFDDLFGEEE